MHLACSFPPLPRHASQKGQAATSNLSHLASSFTPSLGASAPPRSTAQLQRATASSNAPAQAAPAFRASPTAAPCQALVGGATKAPTHPRTMAASNYTAARNARRPEPATLQHAAPAPYPCNHAPHPYHLPNKHVSLVGGAQARAQEQQQWMPDCGQLQYGPGYSLQPMTHMRSVHMMAGSTSPGHFPPHMPPYAQQQGQAMPQHASYRFGVPALCGPMGYPLEAQQGMPPMYPMGGSAPQWMGNGTPLPQECHAVQHRQLHHQLHHQHHYHYHNQQLYQRAAQVVPAPAAAGKAAHQEGPTCTPAMPPAQQGGVAQGEGSLFGDEAIAAWSSRASSQGGSEVEHGEEGGGVASAAKSINRPGETPQQAMQRRSVFSKLLAPLRSVSEPSAAAAVAAVHEAEGSRSSQEEGSSLNGAEGAASQGMPGGFDAAAAQAELSSRWLAALEDARSGAAVVMESAPAPAVPAPAAAPAASSGDADGHAPCSPASPLERAAQVTPTLAAAEETASLEGSVGSPAEQGGVPEAEGRLLIETAIAWSSRTSSRGGSDKESGEEGGCFAAATIVRLGETREEAVKRRSAFSELLRCRRTISAPSAAAAVAEVRQEEATRAAVPASQAAAARVHGSGASMRRPRLSRAPLFVLAMF